jgi:tetratricopeptide (TPR) repeat protein
MDQVLSLNELRSEVTHLRNRVDSLAESSGKTPWYKSVSTLISVAAFVFSFGTTIVSYNRTREQDIHSLRAELGMILQKLFALPKESLEARTKYDANSFAMLNGFINQENILLAKQANDAINRLPKDQVTATYYRAVATALQNSRNFELALVRYTDALSSSNGLDEEIDTLRGLAGLQMIMGRKESARENFYKASMIFNKYTYYDDFTKKSTNILTELSWALGEAVGGDVEAAKPHLAMAEKIVAEIPVASGDVLRSQVAQAKASMLGPPPVVNGPAPVSTPSPLTYPPALGTVVPSRVPH